MPAKNVIKTYVEGGYYHVYNRGVEKRTIFMDAQDYHVFLRYLKEAFDKPLDPKASAVSVTLQGLSFQGIPRLPKNFHKTVDLVAFCLMPNHFHLLLKQMDTRSLERCMRSLMTRYVGYFNKRHKRVGSLFQGPYKAAYVENEEYLLHLSRYIHRNPLTQGNSFSKAYSSYTSYLQKQHISWLKPEIVLSFFDRDPLLLLKKKNINTYQRFVEYDDIDDEATLGSLALDL